MRHASLADSYILKNYKEEQSAVGLNNGDGESITVSVCH